MCASLRATSAPNSPRPEREAHSTVAELNLQVPVECGKTRFPPVNNQMIPDELLVSLASTVCSRSSLGHTTHDHHWKGCGIRRPDAVWHHQHGRKKYKYFLEQPTTLSGAGRDISFLCDAIVTERRTTSLPPLTDRNSICDTKTSAVSDSLVPEEYRVVKNKGLESLELYEDAFTVQLQDEEQRLRVFPSLRPSGRLEVVQLMRMMDDMLMKAGVGQQSEELTELSQMEGLLNLVQVEQNIYNIVFHELIRQVSVGCAERGQLLAKLRQHYQSLLVRIPSHLKALHTEAVAQRALDRRLTEEIHRIKTSIQQLNTELSRIREHDAFVSQQAKHAHQQLAAALQQTHTNSDVVQGYHELYELQRGRLEAQLLQMTEERDCWSQYTFCLALKVISVKKLRLISQLHICKQSWSKTAEHISLYITSKDTEDMKIIMELSDQWEEQLTAFMSQLERTEHAQCEQLRTVQQGITKWLNKCTTQNKCSGPKSERATLEQIHADLKEWSNVLALQLECYQGEKILCCQETLGELDHVQKRWLNVSNQLFSRHPSLVGEPPGGQQDLRELEQVLCELLQQLDMHVSGGGGIHGQIASLLRLMESGAFKIGTMTGRPEMTTVSDWLTLEEDLLTWQSLAEKALQNVSRMQTENEKDKHQPDTYGEAENVRKKVQVFVTSLSNFSDSENQRLSEEISSLHITQTRWMLDLLLLMVPDDSEDQNIEQDQSNSSANISLQTLDENAKMLAEKLNSFSTYISSSCKLILEEQILQNPGEAEGEHEMNECRKLQRECLDWVETCTILLSGVKGDRRAGHASSSCAPLSPACSTPTAGGQETHQDISKEELTVSESPVVKLIGYDGNIVQRKLGESSVRLNGTEELVVSPVTDGSQKAFRDLTTVALLQQELQDSELQVQIAEQRALKAEEALQAAMDKIQNLERKLQGQPRLQPTGAEEKKETPPPSPKTQPVPPRKTSAESKPRSSTRRTKK